MESFQQITAVLAVFGTLGGLLWILRKKGIAHIRLTNRTGAQRRLELVERLSISAQHTVCLVRVDDKVLAIGLSPAGCQLISWKDSQ